jgi:transcriptional regulator with XRE-family HTH domain
MGKKRTKAQIAFCERLQREFGTKLKEARLASGKMQKNIAAGMHLSRTSISNIERGTQRLYLDQLFQAAELLEVAVSALLPTTDGPHFTGTVHTVADNPLPPEVAEEANRVISTVRERSKLKKGGRKVTTTPRTKRKR